MRHSCALLLGLLTLAGCVSAAKTRVAMVPAGGTAVVTLHAVDSVELVSGGDVELALGGVRFTLSRGVPQSIPVRGMPRLVFTNAGQESVAVRLLLKGGAGMEADTGVR